MVSKDAQEKFLPTLCADGEVGGLAIGLFAGRRNNPGYTIKIK